MPYIFYSKVFSVLPVLKFLFRHIAVKPYFLGQGRMGVFINSFTKYLTIFTLNELIYVLLYFQRFGVP
mgnify:CR=1 FL=1